MHKIVVIILALFILSAGCSDKFNTKEELLREGVRLMNANKPGGAIIYLKNALEKDPNFLEARLQLAKAYYRTGKFDSAENEFKKVLKQSPSSRDGHIGLARVHLRKSEPDKALKEIADFTGNTAEDLDALEITGWAYALKGDYAASVDVLKNVLSKDPSKTTTAILLSMALVKMDQTKEAKYRLSQVLEKEPANKEALYLLADIQAGGNNFDDAIDTLDKILKENPSDIEASFKKGVLYVEKGQHDDAVAMSDKLIKTFPNNAEGYRLKGLALFRKKNLTEAVVALQKAASMQPSVGTYYLLGISHYYRNEQEQAMTQLQNALRIAPSFAPARVLTALLLLKDKRTDDAVIEIKKVLSTDEKNALAHNILGSAYLTKGLYSDGLAELNKAIEIDPKLVDAHIKKGFYEISRGKIKEAEAEFTTAVQVNPDLLNTRVLLASSYMKQHEYDKAIKTLNDGIKGQKTDAVLYNLIAEVLLHQNKAAAAIGELQKAEKADPLYDVSYLKAAALFIQTGEFEKGLHEIKSIIAKSPGNTSALLALATLLENRGYNEEALKSYQAAKETGKTEGFLELAKFHMRRKQPDKAIKIVDEAIKRNPSDTVSYEFKGKTLLMQNRFDDALKIFEDLGKINPDLGIGYIINTYISMKKPDKALDRLQRELKRDPERLELMAEISRLDQLMGRKQDAIENARQIIRKSPKSPTGYITLAMIYQRDKETDKAIGALREAPQINDLNLFMALGNLYLSRKDYSSALDNYGKAEGIKPGYVPAIFGRGSAYVAAGKKKEAISEYSRALTFSQNHVPTLNNLAYIYTEENRNLPMALQLAARAYTLAPGDGLVQDTLGFVLLKSGKVNEAVNELRKAVELTTDNPSVYYHLALAYKEQGEKKKAVEQLRKALSFKNFAEKKEATILLDKLQDKVKS